mmetsp:Transcript_15523/g.14055  ORF Transcript_15523/g.14055 Transcript_15523/m.14055 type:complete len:259 (+) Transcript_15523:23-799(+)
MFRESDIQQFKPHPTYTNKPVPILQKQFEVSKFNEFKNKIESLPYGDNINDKPEIIPTTTDTFYDPSHPDADWSGLVSKFKERKHTQSHRSQIDHIKHSENGMTSLDQRSDYDRKKKFEVLNGSNNIIGGIPANDQYKSVYQQFTNHEETSRDQLTLYKRQLPRKTHYDPREANGIVNINDIENNYYNTANNNMKKENDTKASSSTRSFIKGLAQSIVEQVPDKEIINSNVYNRNRDRTLVLENYRPNPGYTGKRNIS